MSEGFRVILKKKKYYVALLSILLTALCAGLNAVNQAVIPSERGRPQTAGTETLSRSPVNRGFDSEEIRDKISILYRKAIESDNTAEIVEIGKVSERTANEIRELGFDVTGYTHNLDYSGVRHLIKRHGQGNEKNKNQLPVTESDFLKIPEILETYDRISSGKRSNIGRDVIKYEKEYDDGIRFYFEEIRTGRKTLTLQTMYIHKK